VQRAIRPQWLLRQADELAGRFAGVGQPRNADLRRAASAAYYALYHELVNRVCEHLQPDATDAKRWTLSRLFAHRNVLAVCEWILGATGIPGAKGPPARVRAAFQRMRTSTRLVDVALAFQTLQQARHEADYDHLADFTRPATLSLIDQSRDAIRKLRLVASVSPPMYQRFMTHLAMCPAVSR